MSGILDNKTRIFDTYLTNEARRQMASGELQIKYVSFTDDATFYKKDVVSGSADATSRIYLECSSLPQDQITLEANDSGNLNPFKNLNGISILNGSLISSSISPVSGTLLSGSGTNLTYLTGTAFASTTDLLIASTIENFKNLRLIGTKNYLFDDNEFEISTNDITFNITNDRPIDSTLRDCAYLSRMESLLSDPRLSNVINYKFLPPINKIHDKSIDTQNYASIPAESKIGNFVPWGLVNTLKIEDVESELSFYRQTGFCKQLTFNLTSKNNTIFGQFFEQTNNTLRKLDVIDFGRHVFSKDDELFWWHVFFVGRVLIDDNNNDTFVHLFTLVFK